MSEGQRALLSYVDLGDYGDMNGDVGKQWLSLFVTSDKAAGDPIASSVGSAAIGALICFLIVRRKKTGAVA